MDQRILDKLLTQGIKSEDFDRVANDPELLSALYTFFWITRIPSLRDKVVQQMKTHTSAYVYWAFENLCGD